jgi:glyoxylase-like metal-dependent hydrolase (beta-lactamase superfamily II)
LRLYAFDCGRMRLASVVPFNIAETETDIRKLAVPCYVVSHPLGLLLWDGGLASARAEGDGWVEVGNDYYERLDRTLADQLQALGWSMTSFDYVAFSHIHYDHVGVANEVRGATWLIQEEEYDAAFADELAIPAVDPTLYEGLREAPRMLLRGDHDVFGDERVRIVSAPGHTPGHQVLYVDLESSGPVVLSGDLYHFRLSRAEQRVPTFNWDADATRASFALVEELLLETGADLWIQHDLARFESSDTAPLFYH